MDQFTWIELVTAAVMLIGLFGLLFVIIPGLTIIWLATLVYGLVTGFSTASMILFGAITLIMIGGNISDNLIMGASARQKGASWLAIGVALLGGLVGSVMMPPFGGLLLALAGLFAVEYIRLKDWRKALDSTKSMAIGCGWAAFLRFGLGMVMIGLWLVWVFVA
jgi:uncharacterized protein YqgC (DUF456 family)